MEDKLKMMKMVGFISVIITGIAMLGSLLFHDKGITLGLGLGCMIGLIGFNMIVQWGFSIQEHSSARSTFMNYLLRYIFYGCMFTLSYYFGANIFALLVGFICHKLAIYVYSFMGNRR